MHYPGDVDICPIELAAGESATVAVESLLDAELWIDDLQPDEDLLAYDSDSGGGVLGLNPRLEFTAERAGTYYFAVQVYDFFAPGGYILTVE